MPMNRAFQAIVKRNDEEKKKNLTRGENAFSIRQKRFLKNAVTFEAKRCYF
jgi:hypothetical protein